MQVIVLGCPNPAIARERGGCHNRNRGAYCALAKDSVISRGVLFLFRSFSHSFPRCKHPMIQPLLQHPFYRFLTDDSGDMVERGLILVAIVVAAVGLWYALGAKLAAKLGEVVGSF